MQHYYVYILKCSDASYYVGHTDDLEARLSEHVHGLLNCYTLNRRPVELMYYEEFATRDEAFRMERKIKGWSRKKKEALIVQNWELISRLSQKKFR